MTESKVVEPLVDLVRKRPEFARLATAELKPGHWAVVVVVDEGYDEQTAGEMREYFAGLIATT